VSRRTRYTPEAPRPEDLVERWVGPLLAVTHATGMSATAGASPPGGLGAWKTRTCRYCRTKASPFDRCENCGAPA
jgi:hypothetical protein